MAITKKIFFSETTGCRKLKLGMYVPTYEDTLICSRRSDPNFKYGRRDPLFENPTYLYLTVTYEGILLKFDICIVLNSP